MSFKIQKPWSCKDRTDTRKILWYEPMTKSVAFFFITRRTAASQSRVKESYVSKLENLSQSSSTASTTALIRDATDGPPTEDCRADRRRRDRRFLGGSRVEVLDTVANENLVERNQAMWSMTTWGDADAATLEVSVRET